MDTNLSVNMTFAGNPLMTGLGAGIADKPSQVVKPIGIPNADAAKRVEIDLTVPKAQVNYDPNQAKKLLQTAIEALNKQVSDKNQSLSFSYDESLKTPVVKVINSNTGDVVRQIPSEQILKYAHNLDQLKGVLFSGAF